MARHFRHIALLILLHGDISQTQANKISDQQVIESVREQFEVLATETKALNRILAANKWQMPEGADTKWKELSASYRLILREHWKLIMTRFNEVATTVEARNSILSGLEQALPPEEYMDFLLRCVDLREQGTLGSETLASLFYGNFAYRGSEGEVGNKDGFLAANYRAPQVQLFLQRATPYLKESARWTEGIESLIPMILSGEAALIDRSRAASAFERYEPALLDATIQLQHEERNRHPPLGTKPPGDSPREDTAIGTVSLGPRTTSVSDGSSSWLLLAGALAGIIAAIGIGMNRRKRR